MGKQKRGVERVHDDRRRAVTTKDINRPEAVITLEGL